MDWNTFYGKVKSGAEVVTQQISETADLASLQLKLSLAEKKLEEAYTALGKASFKHFNGNENTADAVAVELENVKAAGREVVMWKKKIRAKKVAKENPTQDENA